jgi:peptidoglycan/LPS O-acetylase OafA/YrhL
MIIKQEFMFDKEIKYLPNLDAMRFFAASAVMVHHIELYKFRFGKSSLFQVGYFKDFINQAGEMSVWFFFVLSGFLITHLLLKEQAVAGKVSVWNFYVRRSLRIWPLYFLIAILGLIIFPKIHQYLFLEPYIHNEMNKLNDVGLLTSQALIYLTFSIYIFSNSIPPVWGSNQMWSIGVEEHFYLIWPWILILFRKYLWQAFIFILTLKYLFYFVHFESLLYLKMGKYIFTFLEGWRVECMVWGAIAAWFQHKNYFLIKLSKFWQLVVYIVTILFWFNKSIFVISSQVILPILFAVIIYNGAFNKKLLLNFDNYYLNYLGKISYGIYAFHPIVVYLVFGIFDHWWEFNWMDFPGYYIFLTYTLIVGVTILASSVSYNYFEKKFLNLKRNYSANR